MRDDAAAGRTGSLVAVDVPQLRRERLARLRAVMAEADVAAAVFYDPINIRYATDVSNMQVWCLHNPNRYAFVATQGPVVMADFHTCEILSEGVETVDEVRPSISWTYFMAGPGAEAAAAAWAAEIADLIQEHGGGNRRLAVDRLEWTGFLALQRLGIEVVEGQELAEQARVMKTPQELAAMRACVAACEDGVRATMAASRPGMTENEVWSVLHQHNIATGGEWIETRLLSSGPRTNPWYQESSDRVIEPGELIGLDTDLIGRYGYCCDISRTWRVDGGMANDEQRRTYARAYGFLTGLLDRIGPGVTLTEISEQVGPPPEDCKVYTCLIHGVGMCDEYPAGSWVTQSRGYDAVLKPGMTICVESYLGPDSAREGVKLEEQVLITETGIEMLSTLPLEESWL